MPYDFCKINIKYILDLSHNQISKLPKSFCEIRLKGDLSYKIIKLPNDIGKLNIGNILDLS